MSDLKKLQALKTREDFVKYFKAQHFEFEFCSEGIAYFNSLSPIDVDDNLFKFQLAFFTNEMDFFRFSSFENWLDKMQIQEIRLIQEGDSSESILLHSEQYDEHFLTMDITIKD